MPFSFLDPSVLGPAGAAVVAFVGGRFTKRDRRLDALEAEVNECRKRDADFIVVQAGLRVVVGELMRIDPLNASVAMCGDLLNRKLGPPPSMDDFADLITKLDAVPSSGAGGGSTPASRKPFGGRDAR